MKINKLIICGFGPYASKVSIDFEELNNKEIYLITGDTGSGKTSIFDAISFALYGNTSQTTRSSSSLRSDFCDNETETYVEMQFSIHHRSYHIKRFPSYLRDGYKTENKHKAYLLLPNGDIIEGVGEVNQKVLEIVGIDYLQFKHIMMIAQGEFSQLIHAESKDREIIFRKLFDTSKYNQMEEFFKSKLKQQKEEYQQLKERIITRMKMVEGVEVNDQSIYRVNDFLIQLEDINQQYQTTLDSNTNQRNQLNKEIEELQSSIQKIQNDNKLIESFEVVKSEYNELLKNKEAMECIAKKVNDGLKAKEINPFYDHYLKSSHSYQSLHKEKEELKKVINNEQNQVKILTKRMEELDTIQDEIKQKEKQLDSYRESLSIYTKIDNENKEIVLIEKKIKDAENVFESISVLLQRNQDKLQQLQKELEYYQTIDIEAEKLKQLEITYDKKMQSLRNFEKEYRELLALKELFENQVNDYQKVDINYQKKQQEYLQIETIYREDQAGFLAKDLKDNQPCPVCGSLHHPSLAIMKHDEINVASLESLKEEVDTLFKKREEMYSVYMQSKEDIVKIESSMEAKMDKATKDYAIFLKDEKKLLKDEIYILSIDKQQLTRKQHKKISIENDLKKADEEIKKINKDKEVMSKEVETLKVKLKIKQQTIITLKETSRFVDASKDELQRLISKLQKEIQQYHQTSKQYQQEYHDKKLQLESKQGRYFQINEQVNKDSIFIEDLKNKYESKLYQYFSSEEEYLNSCMEEVEISSLQQQYLTYKDTCLLKQKEMQELKDKTVNLSKKDDSIDKQKIQQIKVSIEQLTNEFAKIYASSQKNKAIHQEIEKEKMQYQTMEKRLEILEDISKTMNGQNAARISFESYILASYFDYIIEAANIRFKKMTASRFELLRRTDSKKKRSQQGLDLDVLDYETGKIRDIKTLSGGESFKASLSLALGLSDVIQSQSGGIEVDTLFIDEGFGSLDEQSLDQAIQVLYELNHHDKVIGIISHVQELKERIDSKIIVKKGSRGSNLSIEV